MSSISTEIQLTRIGSEVASHCWGGLLVESCVIQPRSEGLVLGKLDEAFGTEETWGSAAPTGERTLAKTYW